MLISRDSKRGSSTLLLTNATITIVGEVLAYRKYPPQCRNGDGGLSPFRAARRTSSSLEPEFQSLRQVGRTLNAVILFHGLDMACCCRWMAGVGDAPDFAGPSDCRTANAFVLSG